MTLTFNPEKYKELLARHLPKVIRTEAENEGSSVFVMQWTGIIRDGTLI